MKREDICKQLHAQININGHMIGACIGSGMTARYAARGGADLLIALSAGKYRIMGRSSYASYLCYGNNNAIVMDMGKRELFPIIKDKPILFGLLASDPGISLYEYLKEIRHAGFSGVVNFPTVALFDGNFRSALEADGISYAQEVEAIRLAKVLHLFTVAFVTNEDETMQMLDAGADIICVHLGLTKGGDLGAKRHLSITDARKIMDRLFALCDSHPDVMKMFYSGPANTPIDMQYLYRNTACQGYIGGSVFDRIPIERAVLNTTKAFKTYGDFDESNPRVRLLTGDYSIQNSVDFVKKYIHDHYMKEIRLDELAVVAHVSPSYLSTCFRKETGCSFTEYLLRFRISQAKTLLATHPMHCKEVADAVGYNDYAQFSKMFKKYTGLSPTAYRKNLTAVP